MGGGCGMGIAGGPHECPPACRTGAKQKTKTYHVYVIRMPLEIDAPLLRWGNSFAVRVTRAQAEALGARPGQPLHAILEVQGRPSWSFPTFGAGGRDQSDASVRHDGLLGQAVEKEWRGWQGQ